MTERVSKFSEEDINLSEFARNEDFSDVTIRVGGENIPCHRIILVNRIPFFRTLFAASSWKKSAESEVFELEVVTAGAFHEILNYAYSAAFEVSDQNVAELLRASYYLQVEKVITKCVEFVNSTNLGEQVVLEVFLVAFQHNLESLKDKSRNYILSRIASASNNKRFTDLTYYHMEYLFDNRVGLANVKTEYLLDALLKWIEKDNNGMKTKNVLSLLILLNLSMEEKRSLSEKNENYKKLLCSHILDIATCNSIPEKRCAIKPTFYLTAFRYDNSNNLIIEFHFGIFRQDDVVLTGEKRMLPAAARFDGVPEPNHLCYLDDNVFCVTRVNPTVIEQYAEIVTKFCFPNYATFATYASRAKPDCVFFVQYKTYEGTINYEEASLRYYNIRTSEWWVTRVLPEVAKHFLFRFLVKYDDLFILTESDENDPSERIAITNINELDDYHPLNSLESACYVNGEVKMFMRRSPSRNFRLYCYDFDDNEWGNEYSLKRSWYLPREVMCLPVDNLIYAFGKVDSVGPCYVYRFDLRADGQSDHATLNPISLSVRDVTTIPSFN